jgi:hypothetical protein
MNYEFIYANKFFIFKNKEFVCQAPVAHTYNPNYSGGSWFEASLGK